MNKTVSFFEDVLKILGGSYIILTLIGFFDLKNYYNKFGISINEYISASEILIISMDKIGLVLIVIIIQLIIWLTLFDFLFNWEKDKLMSDGKRRPIEHNFTGEQVVKSK